MTVRGSESSFCLQFVKDLNILSSFLLQSMQEGTVVRIMDKGYGFISREGEDKDLFFHSNELNDIAFDSLKEGDKVTFEVTDGPKGPSATNVTKV